MAILSTSTSAFYERSRADMKDLRAQAEALQTQLSSGNKLSRSSDDPVAASRLRALSRLDALSEVDTSNSDRANSDLSLADAAMSDMSTAIIRAKELATTAASSTTSADQRKAIATELDQIHANLLALSNARDSNGHALFGGESAGDAYKLDASGNAVYIGTNSTDALPIGEGQSVTRSMTGPEFLNFTDAGGNSTDIMATIKALSDALKGGSSTPVASAQNALSSLQTGMDALTTGQTVVGTRLAWIDVTDTRRVSQSELRSNEETNIGSTDLATTIAKLQQTMTVLEASQASFTKLANLSLFNNLN